MKTKNKTPGIVQVSTEEARARSKLMRDSRRWINRRSARPWPATPRTNSVVEDVLAAIALVKEKGEMPNVISVVRGGTFRLVVHLESDPLPYNATQRKIAAAAKKLRARARKFNPIVPTISR